MYNIGILYRYLLLKTVKTTLKVKIKVFLTALNGMINRKIIHHCKKQYVHRSSQNLKYNINIP